MFILSHVGERVCQDLGWLQNPSYTLPQSASSPSQLPVDSRDVSVGEDPRRKPTDKKRKKEGEEKQPADKKSNLYIKAGDLEANASYQIDSKADSGNLHYDSLYSGDIAMYRRRFEVVGLGHHQWVELNDGRNKRKDKVKKEKQLRYFKGGNQTNLGEQELLSLASGKSTDCHNLDFLGLEVKQSADSVDHLTLETYTGQSVSYTHLTLPTIYSV